jgi:hypothetical protein
MLDELMFARVFWCNVYDAVVLEKGEESELTQNLDVNRAGRAQEEGTTRLLPHRVSDCHIGLNAHSEQKTMS